MDDKNQRKRAPDPSLENVDPHKKPRLPQELHEVVVGNEATSQLANGLCPHCVDIGNKLPSMEFKDRVPAFPNGPVPGCRGCGFFEEMKWEYFNQGHGIDPNSYDLRCQGHAYSFLPLFAVVPFSYEKSDVNEHKVFKKRNLFTMEDFQIREGKPGYAMALNSFRIDFDRVKQWLKFCDSHHGKLCKKRTSVDGLTVMDCKRRRTKTLEPGEPYFTLSYVWGPTSCIWDGKSANFPTRLERTIEDSMTVVLALGYRYLWVDRYCIPQNSPTEKHSQIQRMGEIYAQSALTIIAVAGDNPNYGLPGVSSAARKTYPSVRTGNLNLITRPPHIDSEVSDSVWSSRGWTYQEGFLARRRLVFTDSQVYFQCEAMHCYESLHVKNLSKFRDKYRGLFPRFGIGETSQEIVLRVKEYALRQFTYDSDALDAFQGVLRAFQSLDNPVRHVCGIIILTPSTFYTTKLLTIAEMFAFGLCWGFRRAPIRRPEFPSWSWVGWNVKKGGRLFTGLDPQNRSHKILVVVKVERTPGVHDDVENTQWWAFGCQGFPRVLVVQAWIIELDPHLDIAVKGSIFVHRTDDTESYQMFDDWNTLSAFAMQTFDELLPTAEAGSTTNISMLILGNDGTYSKLLMLRFDPKQQAYERLPYEALTGRLLHVEEDGSARFLQEVGAQRREIRLI